jgi:hypothetical protein
VTYIVDQAEIELVVCSADKIPRLKESKLKTLKTIVSMDPIESDKVSIEGVKILTVADVIKLVTPHRFISLSHPHSLNAFSQLFLANNLLLEIY